MKLNIPQVYLIDISNKNFGCQCPLSKKLQEMLGLRKFTKPMILLKGRSLTGISKVDFNNGLRFVNIHCNLASKSYNVNPWGKPSDVITSVTVPTDRSLFGSVVSYIDVELSREHAQNLSST